MNLKQLQYFSAVAETNSISRAARELHVAQPPVSRQIALLEDELGVCLFLRNNKGVELTQAGESLYQQSQQLFQNMRMIADSVRDIDAGIQGTLKIGVIFSNIPIVLKYLKSYHERYPQVELYIRLGTPDDLLSDLRQGKLHVLFLRSQTEETSGLRTRILGEDPLELVMCAQTDPAPGEGAVPIQALRDVPMCLLRSDDLWGYNSHLLKECEREGFSPRVVCQCYDTPMTMQLVQAGFGVSFLPRSILETHPNAGIYSKPVVGVHPRSYPVMVWSGSLYYSGCVKNFISSAETL